MPEILAIKNITASHSFGGTPGQFNQSVTSMPVHPVDEVVIRSISWNSTIVGGNPFLYLLWSNITHDVIGTIAGGDFISNCPGTRILLNSPFPNRLEFRLLTPPTVDDGQPVFDAAVTGEIAINMDLISYRRSHVH